MREVTNELTDESDCWGSESAILLVSSQLLVVERWLCSSQVVVFFFGVVDLRCSLFWFPSLQFIFTQGVQRRNCAFGSSCGCSRSGMDLWVLKGWYRVGWKNWFPRRLIICCGTWCVYIAPLLRRVITHFYHNLAIVLRVVKLLHYTKLSRMRRHFDKCIVLCGCGCSFLKYERLCTYPSGWVWRQ